MKQAKTDRKVHVPTEAEDAAINAGIAADEDSPELGAEFFAKAKPAAEVLGTEVVAGLAAIKRPRGRPAGSVAEQTKVPVNLRLDPDVLAAMRETGAGWQTRVNEALRKAFCEPQRRSR